jgi:aminopeptidase
MVGFSSAPATMRPMDSLSAKAAKNVGDIVRLAIKHAAPQKAVVVFDVRTPLSRLLTEAYRAALPDATFMDFDASPAETIVTTIQALAPGDLVVMVQSSNFKLAAFRFRIELFQRGIATVEHVHLERSGDEAQLEIYLDALAYDPAYYVGLAHALKERIDRAKRIVVRCAGTELVYEGGMEPTKLNVGDYTGMKNVGGTFPIGEVFSEPTDLAKVNGEAMLFAFAGIDHLVQMHEPFKVLIKNGILTAPDAPPEFHAVLEQIQVEEEVLVREFGLGLNQAMGKRRTLSDITAFERQKGLHLSLGEKHGVYKKPGFNPKKTHFHIDVFVDIERIEIDGEPIYADGDFLPNETPPR